MPDAFSSMMMMSEFRPGDIRHHRSVGRADLRPAILGVDGVLDGFLQLAEAHPVGPQVEQHHAGRDGSQTPVRSLRRARREKAPGRAGRLVRGLLLRIGAVDGERDVVEERQFPVLGPQPEPVLCVDRALVVVEKLAVDFLAPVLRALEFAGCALETWRRG